MLHLFKDGQPTGIWLKDDGVTAVKTLDCRCVSQAKVKDWELGEYLLGRPSTPSTAHLGAALNGIPKIIDAHRKCLQHNGGELVLSAWQEAEAAEVS